MKKLKKASDEFKVGQNNIGWVDSSFTSEFGDDEIEGGSVLKSLKLARSMTDSEISKEFKVQECTLGDVLETLKNATGDMKDGYSNLFYVKNHPSHVVNVYWRARDGAWYVDGWGRGSGAWDAGRRVFSPATFDSGSSSPKPLDPLKLCQCDRCGKCGKLIN